MTSCATSRVPPTVSAAPSTSRVGSLVGDQRFTGAADRNDNATTDRSQFAEEMLAHLPLLRRVALRRAGRLDLAEDLVQETVARALTFRHQFRSGSNLPAWLCAILRSLHTTAYCRDRRAPLMHSLDLVNEELGPDNAVGSSATQCRRRGAQPLDG